MFKLIKDCKLGDRIRFYTTANGTMVLYPTQWCIEATVIAAGYNHSKDTPAKFVCDTICVGWRQNEKVLYDRHVEPMTSDFRTAFPLHYSSVIKNLHDYAYIIGVMPFVGVEVIEEAKQPEEEEKKVDILAPIAMGLGALIGAALSMSKPNSNIRVDSKVSSNQTEQQSLEEAL
jgi:hypothetical protein